LEAELQKESDARKMQAMVAHLGLVVLFTDGPAFVADDESMPTCMICNEAIKAGEWFYFMTARATIDMSPLVEDQDGRGDEPWLGNTKSFHIHRNCYLLSIRDNCIHPDEDGIWNRMSDPRYKKDYPLSKKTPPE
jgi:hypothetical protein